MLIFSLPTTPTSYYVVVIIAIAPFLEHVLYLNSFRQSGGRSVSSSLLGLDYFQLKIIHMPKWLILGLFVLKSYIGDLVAGYSHVTSYSQ